MKKIIYNKLTPSLFILLFLFILIGIPTKEKIKFPWDNYTIEEAEDLQFAIYKKGDFYGLHKDADEENNRVLSVTVQLSKASEYDGGDLVFDYDRHPMPTAQGTVIIFPSNLYHEVTPVTRGRRYSLVQWFKGKEK